HIVRHPKAVVASMVEASMKWGRVAYWHQSPEKILERWAIHENWVLDAKQEGHPIHTIRLEDLSLHPMTSMKSVFEFLGLEIPEQVAQVIVEDTNPDPNSKYASFHLPHNDNAEQLMKYYNYTNE
ncbi:MAG: sulfotransferase domain-containing protein, partial [Anaerolineaceae bacterium]|nr:sulfotransferase domain-containing protein [Anaerolineaceae bacterium]